MSNTNIAGRYVSMMFSSYHFNFLEKSELIRFMEKTGEGIENIRGIREKCWKIIEKRKGGEKNGR